MGTTLTNQQLVDSLTTAISASGVNTAGSSTPVIPIDKASAASLATTLAPLAVQIVGRRRGVSFNENAVTFPTAAGTRRYGVGKDILTAHPLIMGMREVWHTDVQGDQIDVMTPEDFNMRFKHGTAQGRPVAATLYRRDSLMTLELYPIPNAVYTLDAMIKVRVSRIEDIPEEWHSVVLTEGLRLVNALRDGSMANVIAKEGLHDIAQANVTTWNGSVIPVERPLSTLLNDRGSNDTFNVR